jgi:hypothetical protein
MFHNYTFSNISYYKHTSILNIYIYWLFFYNLYLYNTPTKYNNPKMIKKKYNKYI